MKEMAGEILNHPNAKTLVVEILNETAFFLCDAISELDIWESPDEAKKNLRRILEEYLTTQNRLSHERSASRKTYKEFITDEETARSAMFYLLNTLSGKCEGNFPVAIIAFWIALQKKEEAFKEFAKEINEIEPCNLKESLYAFWIYGGSDVKENLKAIAPGSKES